MDEREEDLFKEWVANVRAHTCDVVRVRAVKKLGVRFACMRPENGSQLTFGDFYDGLYQNLHWKLGQQTPSVGTILV